MLGYVGINMSKKVDDAYGIRSRELVAEKREELGPDYVIFDANNPAALINQVPESLRSVMQTLDDNHRYLTETQLRNFAKADARLAQLRIAFWMEYNNAQKAERVMNMKNVYRGVTSLDYWNEVILKDPKKVAYIIVPPKDYLVAMTELLDMGLDSFRDIIKAPLFDNKGRFDSKTADKVIKVVQAIETRLKGAVVTKTMNLNAEVPATALGMEHINTNSSNLEELEAQVARVRAKLERTESQKNFEVVDAIEGEIVGKTEED
jgi:hypothetical protein